MKKGDCFNCGNCMYHSEGDSDCDVDFNFVLEDWRPTEYFSTNCSHWTPK